MRRQGAVTRLSGTPIAVIGRAVTNPEHESPSATPDSELAPLGVGTGEDLTFRLDYAPLFQGGPRMRALLHDIQQVADTNATVLIQGESGVGKEVVAKTIHFASSRRRRPFVRVNCASLPGELLESELFGHEKGAFTGAYRRKPGKFEIAERGTIFLDEIGELPLALQAKLLHVLQDHEFGRVGGTEVITADVRVVAATNRPLEKAIQDGTFREDLYYRLKVVELSVPPLRERREEIAGLARTFVTRFNQQFQREVTLGPESLRLLRDYPWPGNVRELENMMKRVVVLQNEQLLRQELAGKTIRPPSTATTPAARDGFATEKDRHQTLKDIARQAALDAQREAIRNILERVHWNRAEAARVLGISYKTLLYKIDQCGLARKRPRAGE
jgi:transcriptional regulator with GAF, ATPase, and Fis domain